MFQQNFHDSVRRVSIPKLGSVHWTPLATQNTFGRCENLLWIPADDLIRPLLNGHRTLRIFSKGQARNSQNRALFLNSPRIGEYQTRMIHQAKKVQVALWSKWNDTSRRRGRFLFC